MKKFISGFVCGAILFGGVTVFAADLKGALFNINNVEVDGKKITVNSQNKPFTFQGYAYFPSYMLSDMGYTPSRSSDGKTITLNSTGKKVYATGGAVGPGIDYLIAASDVVNTSALSSVAYDSSTIIRDQKGTTHSNYMYAMLGDNTPDSKGQVKITYQVDEKYRQFNAKAGVIQHQLGNMSTQPITLTVYTTDKAGQTTLYGTYNYTSKQSLTNLIVPLRYVDKITFTMSSVGDAKVEFAMFDPVFIK
ncbi:hypothetical protein [Paenibacillus wynnii]|uniref:hypothetical protein n=1 Tax=Paenibacillus wynnii TaxID=268407 RepID=UPI0027930A6D|nr:hypothetical protein [Paenibacillus wynnii]MDQ0194711.1 hypothetical protein [Paenibacillus wynnii]